MSSPLPVKQLVFLINNNPNFLNEGLKSLLKVVLISLYKAVLPVTGPFIVIIVNACLRYTSKSAYA